MSQVIIASQLDEDFNEVIRERLASIHPEAQVIGVPAGVPSDLPPRRISCCCAQSMCAVHRPDHSRRGLTARSGSTGVSGIDLYPRVAVRRPPVTTSGRSAA